jgi:hypothetical protein
MKAIQIKYLSPTNTKGSRLKVYAEGCKPFIASRDYAADYGTQAYNLADDYILLQGWNCKISGFGQLPNGDYVATLG